MGAKSQTWLSTMKQLLQHDCENWTFKIRGKCGFLESSKSCLILGSVLAFLKVRKDFKENIQKRGT